MAEPLVGIIANPASGRDIRRFVAYGSVFDNNEKMAIVRRMLLGLEAVGIRHIAYMPEHDFGIVPRALDGLQRGERRFSRVWKHCVTRRIICRRKKAYPNGTIALCHQVWPFCATSLAAICRGQLTSTPCVTYGVIPGLSQPADLILG